jgi:hypothetical protein
MDATQFTVGNNKDGRVRVKYVGQVNGNKKAMPNKGDNTTGLSFFIKYYLLINAAGDAMDPVFVVADDNMQPEVFHAYEIPGLGIGTDIGSRGHLVFCATRGCNLAFYKWLNNNFLVPSVMRIRSAYNLPDDCLAWFQLDGEPKQIECYEEQQMLDHLSETFIAVGKPSASTTSRTQAADNSNCFKAPKTRLKNINDEDVELDMHMRQHVVQRIRDCIANHVERTTAEADASKPSGCLSYVHRNHIVYGLVRIQKAIQSALFKQREDNRKAEKKSEKEETRIMKIEDSYSKKLNRLLNDLRR